jgi:anti-sigma regulatory factor (Ser/Thr protein kinase)
LEVTMIALPVSDTSQVAEARRRASEIAQGDGFAESEVGRVALVTTELATNLVKHGGGGEILIGTFQDCGSDGVELLALDSGAGIANVKACLEDGYSSAGTAGHGLGAVHRQSDFVDIATWPGKGTAVLARLEGTRRPNSKRRRAHWGAVTVPKPGEVACGDAWSIADDAATRTIMVADGLGHGPEAAAAAVEAVRIFQRHKGHQVPTILEYVHGGLRATRGAAVSIARLDKASGRITFAGVGNVASVAVNGANIRRMVSLNGTAGHNARKIQAFDYPFDGGVLILHSDGLGTGWNLNQYPGLIAAHPTLIAGVLYRDFWRRRDDVTIVVATGVSDE